MNLVFEFPFLSNQTSHQHQHQCYIQRSQSINNHHTYASKKSGIIINLQHRLQISRNLERSGSLAADLLDGHALGVLGKSQTLGGADFEDGQIGDDLPHAAGSGQGEAALGEDLGVALLVGVFLFKLC